ncbi:MAG: DUF805 domain-containing protein [Alphaproteobacteria bacterium]|nr:DUF805 domain-containing protein [Alphaproteobacteria bacterium]MDE2012965.1 DUF805 domain-containing protein [Alphaproteobacteria bacterium]MDE2073728.1 DUF805 domain-containing protein [Alphaproteobacteria bacterium]MDE2351992.1 DUF805 domain-containing protein [Alphaproteobacteria bacterium]
MDPNAVVETFRQTITEHYVDFAGRCGRRTFWYYVAAYVVCYVVLAIVQSVLGTHALTGLFSLALLLPGLGISVRRLHDTNRSGWWILLGAVPGGLMAVIAAMAFITGANSAFGLALLLPIVTLAAMALLIYWYAQPGDTGGNLFGPPPADAPAAPA